MDSIIEGPAATVFEGVPPSCPFYPDIQRVADALSEQFGHIRDVLGDLKLPESAPEFATLKDLSIGCFPLNYLHRHNSLLLPVYPVPWPMISLYTQNSIGSLPAPSHCVSIYRKTTMLGSCKRTKRGAEVTHSQPSALLYMGRGWLAMDNFGPISSSNK